MSGVQALIVSGFLGSGKTTLVRDQLAQARAAGVRVALVSNEFGALGIDRELLGSDPAYIELEGGCVCCQLSDELVQTLEQLRRDVPFERVIVETSGVALPYETQLQFWREPVSSWVVEDCSLVVVNAEQLRDRRDLDGTFEDQVGSADLLLLNKLDLVPAAELPALERALAELAPDTPILRATQGCVGSDVLFLPDAGRAARRRAGAHAHDAEHAHDHAAFRSEELAVRRGVSERELRELLARHAPLRAKGFVETEGGLRLVQGVGPRVQIEPVERPPDPALIGRVVLISRAAG